jgi:hypothetical protein
MGNAGWMPLLPLTLRNGATDISEWGLIDSGAAANILPYDIGVGLGLDWNSIAGSIPLGGMLAGYPAKPVLLEAIVASFPPVRLAFAWTRAPTARLLLGQTNFFMEFDVFFARARGYFELQPAISPTP